MELIQPILDYINQSDSYSALHVCRGNYTKDESGLLKGSYAALSDFFSLVQPNVLMLEFSTPRAGEIKDLFINEYVSTQSSLGLGVVNPKSDTVESVDYIKGRIHEALKFLPPNKIWQNPDCGFATFEQRPMNSYNIIRQKIEHMKQAQFELLKELEA